MFFILKTAHLPSKLDIRRKTNGSAPGHQANDLLAKMAAAELDPMVDV